MKIAIIEDDPTIGYAVDKYLKIYKYKTHIYKDLDSAEKIKFDDFDLLILDENLPDGSGFDYLKWLRSFSDIPVIMLTVKDADEYIVEGLSIGADDYITKPFSLKVLKARMDNIFRRQELDSKNLDFKDLSLNLRSKTAKLNDLDLNLNIKEFSVLEILLENKDMTVRREEIIDNVWAYELYEINDNTLTVTVKRLRKKLGSYSKYIVTKRGIGYMRESEIHG